MSAGVGLTEEHMQGLQAEHESEAIRERLAAPNRYSYLADGVLGAIDGCVTTLAIVAGTAGASLPSVIAIVLGLANLLADGISMAISNFQSARTRVQQLERTRRSEEEHIRHVPHGEREEIRQIFANKGFSGKTLDDIVATITSNPKLWVDTMLVEEHGLALEGPNPVMSGTVTFVAFVAVGAVPLLPYLVPALPADRLFSTSVTMALVAFFGIGLLKGYLLGTGRAKIAIETTLAGSAAAALAWAVGHVLRGLVGTA